MRAAIYARTGRRPREKQAIRLCADCKLRVDQVKRSEKKVQDAREAASNPVPEKHRPTTRILDSKGNEHAVLQEYNGLVGALAGGKTKHIAREIAALSAIPTSKHGVTVDLVKAVLVERLKPELQKTCAKGTPPR